MSMFVVKVSNDGQLAYLNHRHGLTAEMEHASVYHFPAMVEGAMNRMVREFDNARYTKACKQMFKKGNSKKYTFEIIEIEFKPVNRQPLAIYEVNIS